MKNEIMIIVAYLLVSTLVSSPFSLTFRCRNSSRSPCREDGTSHGARETHRFSEEAAS